MTARIDLIAPATITLLGSLVESADPVSLSVIDPAAGTLTVTIIAGNQAARLAASAAAGATVASNANTLTITGNNVQVNAALASLDISDPVADTLSLTAIGPGALAAATDIAVIIIPAAGPAFAAPPASIALSPYILNGITGLVLGDPAALALDAAGLGQSETMAMTLSAASGVLFLPNYTPLSGISAAGVGTAQIVLTFTADQLSAVNGLLAGLQWAGPAAISGLAYAVRDVTGPLGATVTSGNAVLNIAGVQGPLASLATGADGAILGVSTLSIGNTLHITGDTADIGGIYGQGSVFIEPGAALEVPYNLLSLGGTSFDFGALSAASLAVNGALLAPDGAEITGPANLGSLGEIDFGLSLIAGAADIAAGMLDLSLAAGALITGNGNLVAGNFSEAGAIAGAGTILAAAGETLVIAAGQISGVALEVAGSGVLELGPVDPLYGVFAATPLSIGAGTTLTFLNDSGAAPASGAFADTLAPTGGAIVISSPQVFAGKIVNFAAGDRLIFPGLSFLNLSGINANGFTVYGPDSLGTIQTYTINAAIPAGETPFVGLDAAGDYEVSLRDAQPDVFLNGSTISQTVLTAAPGIAQPLAGLSILAGTWNGKSLTVTFSVAHGLLSGPGIASAGQVIITAANPTALNTELQSLAYTGNSGVMNDLLTITSTSAPLAGLFNLLPIALNTGTSPTNGNFGDAAQAAIIAGNSAVPLQAIAAPGALIVTGNQVFDTALDIPGLNGTALEVATGARAIFDPGAVMNLGGSVTVSSGGLLGVLTSQFSLAGDLTEAGSLIITGALTAAGHLLISGTIFTSGVLNAGSETIATSGLAQQSGGQSRFGTLNDAGTLELYGAGTLNAGSANVTGELVAGGTSTFSAAGALSQTGTIIIGPDALLDASLFNQTGGTLMLAGAASFSGVVSDAVISLSGGTLLSPSLSLQTGGQLDGAGVVGAAGSLGVLDVNGGSILASGFLILADDLTLQNGGAIAIAGSSALDLVHGFNGGTISFQAGNAELTINDVSQFNGAVAGMLDHDVIDMIGVAPSLVSYAGGEVSATDGAGNPLGQFALAVANGQPGVKLLTDGAGGTLITLGGDMPCFARGTRLLTPNGYRPVENFAPGDPVITHAGEKRAIRWIGWRTLDLKSHDPARPVLFAPHSLAPGMPKRPVTLSPLHAVFLSGVLVPACHLVNGATIKIGKPGPITYYHVELDRHDILLADGMPAESYLDTGNRGQLYAERGRRGYARVACARLVTTGVELAAIRRRLHDIALNAGFGLTYGPAVRGVAGGTSVLPRRLWRQGRRELRFAFAKPAAVLGLATPAAAPADTDPDSEDRRQLGLCLAEIPAGVTLASGWYAKAADDAGIWMGAGAKLAFGPAARQELTLGLAAVIRSWVPPAPVISQDGR